MKTVILQSLQVSLHTQKKLLITKVGIKHLYSYRNVADSILKSSNQR